MFKPIFVLTKVFGTEEEYKLLADWARQYEQNFRAMLHHNPDILAMLEVLKRSIEGKTITGYLAGGDIIFQYHLKDLAHLYFGGRWYQYKRKDSNAVSAILDKIGISYRDRDKIGMYFKTTLDHLNGRLEFYGLEPIAMSSETDVTSVKIEEEA